MSPAAAPNPAPPSPPPGRPRDSRSDGAVLQATAELLQEVGYLQLTVGAIAERAGTNKPAIYRRWPTKAHLVHEAVFPPQRPETMPAGDDLRSGIRTLVAAGVELLGSPAARAALPGLLAEMNSNPTLRTHVLGRFAGGGWGWLQGRLAGAIASGAVRADLQPSTVLEIIAGTTMVATIIRGECPITSRSVNSGLWNSYPRRCLSSPVSGLPMLLPTTRGWTTGVPRTVALAYAEIDGAYVVVGGDHGASRDPQWVRNVAACPEVEVEIGRERCAARATRLDAATGEALWPRLVQQLPTIDLYRERAARPIPVVRVVRW